MIDAIIRAASRKPLGTLVLVAAAAVLGAFAYGELRRDVFPDLSVPLFSVIVQNPSMDAEQLETTIALPLEAALAGVPGSRRVRSVSQLGVVQVTIELEPDQDFFRARQLVNERVQQAARALPAGTEPPLVSSLTGRLNEIMELTLEVDSGGAGGAGGADLMTLRDLAELEVRGRLLTVPGVAEVERLGGYVRELQVQLDPDRMVARGISLEQVLHAVEGANASAPGGIVTQGPMEWSVRVDGRVQRASDVGDVVVAVRGATPVLLSDVADVREAPALRRGLAHRLQGEIVSCRVVKQLGADTMRVAAGVRAAVVELQRGMPQGVRLRVAYDQAQVVDAALSGVGRAVLIGAGFVVLVLLLLLGDVRAALLVTLTIPLSLLIACGLLERLGVGLNTMTLGGLAIAVGLLVDASIIVVDNVMHRLRGTTSPSERRAAAVAAACEVGKPITFATLIVLAVFLPVLGMSGIEGRMYQPLALAVMASMLSALLLALTLTPLAAGALLRPPQAGKPEQVWLVRKLEALYAPALAACMRRAGLVRLLSLALVVPALVLGTRLGADFMPELDEGALLLQTVLPAEASLDQVDRSNHRVEDVLRTFPEVVDVVRRTGRSERSEDPMPHTISDVLVVLKPERTRSLEALTSAMRARLAAVPGVTVLFTTPLGMRIDEGLGASPANLSVRLFGPDLAQLTVHAERARELASRVRGITDLRVESMNELPQLRVEVDRAALARVGLTPGDVARAVRIGLVGEVVSEVYREQRRFQLVVRLQDDHRGDAAAIRNLLLDGHDGTRIPLSQVARVEQVFGPGAIRREAGSRRVAVEASVAGRDLASTAAELRELLTRELKLPSGYFVEVGGRVETQARAMRALALALGLAVLAVFLLLYFALGSGLDALVILAALPEAFLGAIVALALAGETWNVSSLVGLIGLFGIAVQNGLVLVTQTRALAADGRPFEDALRQAAIGRVRPKLMTALTAILGLLPLLVLPLHGTEIERPLAITMIGGLVTSTVFTLLALPTFYVLVNRVRERARAGRSERAA